MNELMDDIQAAINSVDEDNHEETDSLPEVPEGAGDERPAEEENQETSPTQSPEKESVPDDKVVPVSEAKAPKEKVDPPKKEATPPSKGQKAPASWSPANREHWAKLPDNVKTQVAKREAEVNKVLQDSATARNAASQLNQVMAPYQQGLMAAGYGDPFTAINAVMQAESSLRMGNAQQKANAVANLIHQYGIDIGQLDSILAGSPNTQAAAPNGDMEAMIDSRMKPFNDFVQQQNANQMYQQEQDQQTANSQVSSFSADKEFINDVRMDMADLLDMAAKHGQTMTLDQAYQKACAIHPEISKVMGQRQEQQRVMGTQQVTAAKKNAASASLTGSQGGAGGGAGEQSLYDTIKAAWDDNMRPV